MEPEKNKSPMFCFCTILIYTVYCIYIVIYIFNFLYLFLYIYYYRLIIEISQHDESHQLYLSPVCIALRVPVCQCLLHNQPRYWSHWCWSHSMSSERLAHRAVTLIWPHWGGSFCGCLCVGLGVGAVHWADLNRTQTTKTRRKLWRGVQ